jgi:AcrR family transcriptional regulator
MTVRTYVSTKRAASAQLTRERLIAAATELLKSPKDNERFSLEAVAKAAQVTRLTVYKQFGSRSALLQAAFDQFAVEGGLVNISRAMSDADPRQGLKSLIEIFCNFWVFCQGGLDRLHAYSLDDQELRDGLHNRNERRRRVLSVLVGRMIEAKTLPAADAADIVDVLFGLMDFQFFTQLQHGGRSPEEVKVLIQALVGVFLESRTIQSMK